MRTTFLTLAIAIVSLTPLSGQEFDVHLLDKLGENAKSSANVTLNSAMLKRGAAFLGSDKDADAEALKTLAGKLKAIYIRSYKYDRPGQYSVSDLAPFQLMLAKSRWTLVVDVKKDGDLNQIYLLEAANDKLGGIAIISLKPTKVNVVFIDGELDPADLARLSGNMGIPEINSLGNLGKDDNKTRKLRRFK